MKNPRLLVTALALVGVLGFARFGLAQPGPDADNPPEIQAEAFLGTDDTPSVAAAKGKRPVLVEFWATWCPPCRRSIPHLNELQEKYGDTLLIVGLTDEDKETVERFQKKMEMKYPVGVGSTSGRDYAVRTIPHAFLIDKSGKIVWSGNPLDKAIDAAIAKVVADAKG